MAVVAAGALLVASNGVLLSRTASLDRQVKELRGAVRQELLSIEEQSRVRTLQQSRALDELRARINETGSRSVAAANAAQTYASVAARRYSEELARRLDAQQRAQIEQHRLLSAELGEMRQVAAETGLRMTGIASDVGSVRSDVVRTKSDIERTLQELRTVQGDLGVQSGRIATNARELAALKSLGDRIYYEFSLAKTRQPQRVGDIGVTLKKWDQKRNRYTIEVLADDKRVEKRDRTVNEPVQFYMANARVPYEIVVNEVRPDRIVGYLAAPKLRETRVTASR